MHGLLHSRAVPRRPHLSVLRYATTSTRSFSFLKPGKAIEVPLTTSFGLARKESIVSSVQVELKLDIALVYLYCGWRYGA